MAYTEKEAKELVIEAGKKLLEAGLIARTWGNISARISDTQFVITPSGRDYESLTPDEIVVVNIEDCSYTGRIKPSSEKGVHAAAYRFQKNVNFVIHTHQIYASAVSILGIDLKVGQEWKNLLGSLVPCAEYGLSATKKLTDAVSRMIQSNPDSRAILMRNHGTLCMGTTQEEAFLVAKALEEVSKNEYQISCNEPLLSDKQEITEFSIRENDKVVFTKGSKVTRFQLDAIPSDLPKEALLHVDIYKKTESNCIFHATTPYIEKMSALNQKVAAYIDDMAQIAGVDVRCAHNEKQVINKLRNRNAVLVKESGALCIGSCESDVKATAFVLEKGCVAAYLATKKSAKPVNRFDALKERIFYVKSYSKLREQ